MRVLKFLLDLAMALIYAFYALAVVYFPIGEILSYAGRETRLFTYKSAVSINDVLLPAFLVAILYSGIAFVRRRLDTGPRIEPAMDRKNSTA